MSEPRAYTADEARDLYLAQIRNLAWYWANLPNQTEHERCDGVAFSILALLDGVGSLPACDLVVRPHPDDEQYRRGECRNWFEDGQVINNELLHELFHVAKKEA